MLFSTPYKKTIGIGQLLEQVATALDITEAQYQTVVDRYTAVARHLAKEGSPLSPYSPDIKPQGSFLIGTMVRPLIEDDELDVDLVCRLSGKGTAWAQYHLKHAVGGQLKADETYKRMLDEEGNRCWTLVYAESAKFHMDILPAIVGSGHFTLLERSFASLDQSQVDQLAIRITDKRLGNYTSETNTINWLKSNPFGYAAWFKERSRVSLLESRSIRASVEPLPVYEKRKEPLQRVVQLLKRHRDIMYGGDPCKPISIIITTLAARAYNREADVSLALSNVLQRMESFIEERYSPALGRHIKWVGNPVNPEENFADRWILESERERNFYEWLEKAKEDFAQLLSCDLTEAYRYSKELFGTRSVNEAVEELGVKNLITERYQQPSYLPAIINATHRQHPQWQVAIRYKVEIHGHYKNSKGKRVTITGKTVVPKNCDIFFVASTNVPKPFDVYWQIVNTGEEAKDNNGLRGGIFYSRTRGKGGLNQKEYSSYKGTHWAECFIVKSGVCVARSYEFIVNIGE